MSDSSVTPADREKARGWAEADLALWKQWQAGHNQENYGRCDAFLAGLALGRAGLTWTATPPTEAGWYWMRGEPDLNAVVVWVSTSGYIVRAGFPETSTFSFMRANPRCQWCPIPSPQEPRP